MMFELCLQDRRTNLVRPYKYTHDNKNFSTPIQIHKLVDVQVLEKNFSKQLNLFFNQFIDGFASKPHNSILVIVQERQRNVQNTFLFK